MGVNHPGDLLSAYLDGELAPEEMAGVDAHLAGCDECRAEMNALAGVRLGLRSLPVLEPPAHVLAAPAASDHPLEMLSALLDGELAGPEYDEVMGHLGSCAFCREELRDLDAARTATRSLPVLDVPEDTLTMPVPVPITAARSYSRRRRALAWASSAAAALVLVAGIAVSRTPAEEVDLDSLAGRHLARMSVEQPVTAVPALSPMGETP
jgi:anti-sigma factor RsiW